MAEPKCQAGYQIYWDLAYQQEINSEDIHVKSIIPSTTDLPFDSILIQLHTVQSTVFQSKKN